MPARLLGALAVTTALVVLPSAAHAAEPAVSASTAYLTRPAASHAAEHRADVAGPADPASTRTTDTLVVLGLAVLVGGAVLLTATGRRPDDDEPAE